MKEFSEECIGAEAGTKTKGLKLDTEKEQLLKKALLDMLSSLESIMML